MPPKLPEINKDKDKYKGKHTHTHTHTHMATATAMMSSQSVDQFPDGSILPSVKGTGTTRRSKRGSKDDLMATHKRSKKLSMDSLTAPKMKNSKRPSKEFGRSIGPPEGSGESYERTKKKVKTNKVTINSRKLKRGMSSGVYTSGDENPIRKFVTKHLRDADSPAALVDIKTFWLYTVSLVSRTAFLNCLTNSPCAFASPLAIDLAKKRLEMNMRLVFYIKRRCLWFRKKIKVKTDFVRNHGWKLVLFWRCLQRRKAVILLRRMLADHESFRLPYVMLRYRVNAVHLQRYVRSFLEVTEGRKHVLLVKWNKISAHMKANLIPYLFDLKAREDEERRRKNRGKWQGVEIDPEVLPTIGARVNLITKRTAALQVQIQSSEAKIQKHRMELFAKRNRKKKQKMMSSKLPAIDGNDDFDDEVDEADVEVKAKPKVVKKYMGGDREQHEDNRKILQIISSFVYECRRNCKFMEQHKVIVRAKKKKEGMTCEEARKILTNHYAAMTFAEEIASTEVRLERVCLLVFTGQQDYNFRLLVENHLRAENGFELKEYCTEYESPYQSKSKK